VLLQINFVLVTVDLFHVPFLAEDISDKETRDRGDVCSTHPLADYLNYRQTDQPLAQDHPDLQHRISHLDRAHHASPPSSDQESHIKQDTYSDVRNGQAAHALGDTHFGIDAPAEQDTIPTKNRAQSMVRTQSMTIHSKSIVHV